MCRQIKKLLIGIFTHINHLYLIRRLLPLSTSSILHLGQTPLTKMTSSRYYIFFSLFSDFKNVNRNIAMNEWILSFLSFSIQFWCIGLLLKYLERLFSFFQNFVGEGWSEVRDSGAEGAGIGLWGWIVIKGRWRRESHGEEIVLVG